MIIPMATRVRLQITRAGITTPAGASEYLKDGMRFAGRHWGFPDGSVLVWLGGHANPRIINPTPVQVSRCRWKAFNLN